MSISIGPCEGGPVRSCECCRTVCSRISLTRYSCTPTTAVTLVLVSWFHELPCPLSPTKTVCFSNHCTSGVVFVLFIYFEYSCSSSMQRRKAQQGSIFSEYRGSTRLLRLHQEAHGFQHDQKEIGGKCLSARLSWHNYHHCDGKK